MAIQADVMHHITSIPEISGSCIHCTRLRRSPAVSKRPPGACLREGRRCWRVGAGTPARFGAGLAGTANVFEEVKQKLKATQDPRWRLEVTIVTVSSIHVPKLAG